MRVWLIVLALAVCFRTAEGAPGFLHTSLFPYVGVRSSEAVLTFEQSVEFEAAKSYTPEEMDAGARWAIDEQLRYLFGPLQFDDKEFTVGPKRDHKIKVLEVVFVEGEIFRARYSYEGIVTVKSSERTIVPISLPKRTDGFYERGGRKCTDPSYPLEQDFWYFWSPLRKGCKLREGVDFTTTPGTLVRRPITTETYPEYDRLADASGTIAIDVFFGMNDEKGRAGPQFKDDRASSDQYKAVRSDLRARGFKLESHSPTRETRYYTELFSKQEQRARITVRLFHGHTGMRDPRAPLFRQALVQALRTSALVIYNGHSGLGGNLHLNWIEKEQGPIGIPKDRYQIYAFNGCSSYAYYVMPYFGRKATQEDPAGTKNLDILSNGVESLFQAGGAVSSTFIAAVDDWASDRHAPSYQEILSTMKLGDFLTGISGDEDNAASVPGAAPELGVTDQPAEVSDPNEGG